MENIDLALYTVKSSGEIRDQSEPSRSETKTEGGFAGILESQEERAELNSENNSIAQPQAEEKQTAEVDPEKRSEHSEQSRVTAKETEDGDNDVEIEEEIVLQVVPSQEVPSEEISIAGTFFNEGLLQIAENEGSDGENSKPGIEFSDLLGNRDNLLQQNAVFDQVSDKPEIGQLVSGEIVESQNAVFDQVSDKPEIGQSASGKTVELKNDLLAGIPENKVAAQVSFTADEVVGMSPEVVPENYVAGENAEENSLFVALESDAGTGGQSENKIKPSDDPGIVADLIQKGGPSSDSGDKPSLISAAEITVPGLELRGDLDSVKAVNLTENFSPVEREQISKEVTKEPVVVAANPVDLKVGGSDQQLNSGLKSLFEPSSSKATVSPDGSVAIEIPEDVKININNESAAAVVRPENKTVRVGRRLRNPSLSGGETGTVHLQGRARENQSIFAQGESGLIKYSDPEINSGNGEKFTFSETGEKIFDEHFSLSAAVQTSVKEKPELLSFDHAASKTHEMMINIPETGKESMVKTSSLISAKPLPVSDENLMEQIQTGLARQAKGRQTVTIKLWPESLGKIDVKLVLRDQQLSATFMVEQSDVKDAMLRKLDSLRDSLSMRGIDVKEIDIKVAPTKSGDGPSVTVGDQHQESADAWRQYHKDGSSQSGFDMTMSDGSEGDSEDSVLLPENLSENFISPIDSGGIHIMA